MYVRDAKNRDEVWLLDQLEELALDDPAFRSRDYVLAVDETTGDRAGFGRIQVHRDEAAAVCELRNVGVLPEWQSQGVGAHVIERLVKLAGDGGFTEVYTITTQPRYCAQFGFTAVDSSGRPPALADRIATVQATHDGAITMMVPIDDFVMPDRLRERFKTAAPATRTESPDPETSAEDFGIDEDATYKYDLD